MSANDELPRGWFIPVRTAGNAQAIITLPAIAGVTHILTDVSLSLNATGASAATNVPIEIVTTSIPNWYTVATGKAIIEAAAAAAPAGNTLAGPWSWAGKIIAPTSDALTVRCYAGAIGWVELLTIAGYDI